MRVHERVVSLVPVDDVGKCGDERGSVKCGSTEEKAKQNAGHKLEVQNEDL